MKIIVNSIRQEMRFARQAWGDLGAPRLRDLRSLLVRYKFSVILGEITRIDSCWYVTHSGLLQLASRRKCAGIRTSLQERLSDPAANRWVFRAVVYKGANSKGFVGYGDADPSNTSPLVRGAELRVAETRPLTAHCAKLMESASAPSRNSDVHSHFQFRRRAKGNAATPPNGNGSGNGQPRLRDKLCLLIRKYELDPNLVKRYAADFCGTESLREAGRDLVEAFVSTVAEEAAKDRAALLCKLNSYSQPEEVRS